MYIGISEDNLKHMLGVARKAYALCKDFGLDEDYARHMFVLGYNHDIGYEFSENPEDRFLQSLRLLDNGVAYYREGKVNRGFEGSLARPAATAVGYCSYVIGSDICSFTSNLDWVILTIADLTIDNKGNEISVIDRLAEIKNQYGADSGIFKGAHKASFHAGLLSENGEQITVASKLASLKEHLENNETRYDYKMALEIYQELANEGAIWNVLNVAPVLHAYIEKADKEKIPLARGVSDLMDRVGGETRATCNGLADLLSYKTPYCLLPKGSSF